MDDYIDFHGASFVAGILITIILFCVGFMSTDIQNRDNDKRYWHDGKCIECEEPLFFNKKTKEGYVFECSADTNHEKVVVHAANVEIHNY